MQTHDVVITPRAARDLESIATFMEAQSPDAAGALVRSLLEAADSLAFHPARCPLAPEGTIDAITLRHKLAGSYRVIFEVRTRLVIIHAFRHAARLPLPRLD